MTATATNKLAETSTSMDEFDGIKNWVSKRLGGTVVWIERQRRWRPVWRVEVDRDGKKTQFLFKASRAWDAHPYPLEYELGMLEALATDNQIPLPPLYGMCDFPKAIVMEWMPGGRDAGLVLEAMESKSVMTPDRWAASLEYMEILAKMHSIDAKQFEAKGAKMPRGAAEIALNSFERFYDMSVKLGTRDPFAEFCAHWLRRNVPKHRSRISFVTGDCGQFLSQGPKVTSVLDMEVGHLGDHMHDLACYRGRHPIENMGDLPALFRHYEKALGEPLDLPVIAYHTVVFLCIGYYAPLFALDQETLGGDWVESAMQVAMIGRRCVEALAEIVGVTLDPVELPEPHRSPMEKLALRKLDREIRSIPPTTAYPAWLLNTIAAIPKYLEAQADYREWAENADLDDSVSVLGFRPADLPQLDEALISFICKAGPEHDRTLIVFFYRRLLRQCLIIAGPGAPPDHLMLAKVEPILPPRAL